MNMLNQPFTGQLGEMLIEKLCDNTYNHFTILSAFAKNSGVLRLKSALQEFKTKGGSIEAFIGVDAHGTSYEAVTNLLELCDALYIVHSESSGTTFHSKVYTMSNDRGESWTAVGSNNLTGGGLWTNFESAVCFTSGIEDIGVMDELTALLDRYRDPMYACSRQIRIQADIDALLSDDYLRREINILLDVRREQQVGLRAGRARVHLFGTQNEIRIPRIPQRPTGPVVRNANRHTEAQAVMPITATNDTERMWFETRKLTGGSRNILDLSKLGSISQGSSSGTRYETNINNLVLGGVAFFGVDPENTDIDKAITVNYNGVDYADCNITFPKGGRNPNGSWRLQLRGLSAEGQAIQNVEGKSWLQDKLLLFERITSNYYVMYVLDTNELNHLEQRSRANSGAVGPFARSFRTTDAEF